jgi:hypothetical protein
MNAFARIASLLALPLVFFTAGCTSQSEGQRCDPLVAGDCQTGLICRPVEGQGCNYAVCCPAGPSAFAACNSGLNNTCGTTGTNDGSTDGAGETAVPDAQTDSATDASEASPEPATEAGEETSSDGAAE